MTVPNAHQFDTVAPTSELAVDVDVLQYELGGPCVAAILELDEQVRVEDLGTEARWPEFAAAAVLQTPVRSMLSSRVHLDADEPFGALNLYARRSYAFDADAELSARLLAAHTAPAVALVRERAKVTNLQRALESSRIIGTAIGVLMTRRLVTADEAFELLRSTSQQSHRKLRDIALEVTETGLLDVGLLANPQRRPTTLHRATSVTHAMR
ncbi:MAG: ANTAR domain-containing protein [Jatrophihabitans sp.]